jgi:hypothetical protein
MRRGVNGWVAALALMCTLQAAQAYKVPCECSVYLSDNGGMALVIDNETGAVDAVDVVRRGPDTAFGMSLPSISNEMSDCSRDGIACVVLNRETRGVPLAFKAGAIGDTYKVGDVTYSISRIAALPHRGSAKIYTISFTGGARGEGAFVYSESAGIVRFSTRADYWLTLIDGPGLLSPGGFPAAAKR